MNFKEYYKRKLYEDISQQPEPPHLGAGLPPPDYWKPKLLPPSLRDIGIELYQPFGNLPGNNLPPNIIVPPGTFSRPNPEDWPPIPQGMLPTYVSPNGSMVWVLGGPPTIIYVLQVTNSGNESGLQNIQYNYMVYVSTNENEIVGNDDTLQNWVGFEYDASQWIPLGTSTLGNLYPGWNNPHFLPPGEWDIVPGYSPSYDPIYDPNWIDPFINPFYPEYVPRRP